MLSLSVITMLPAIGKNNNIVGGVGAAVATVECVILLVSVFLVERALGIKAFRYFLPELGDEA